MLRRSNPYTLKLPTMVRGADLIFLGMRQLAFDRVPPPSLAFHLESLDAGGAKTVPGPARMISPFAV